MNLSHLVDAGRLQQEQIRRASSFAEQQQRQHQQSQAMASTMVASPYTAQQNFNYMSAPQAPPSPPVEESSKCSLPSISSLLGLTDEPSTSPQPQPQQVVQAQEFRGSVNSTRGLPPTPPMQSESGFDGRQSPSATSQYSVASTSAPVTNYYFTSGTTVEQQPQQPQRQQPVAVPRRVSYNAYPQFSPQPHSFYTSPMQAATQPQVSGLYYQRPLPQSFPPTLLPVSVTLTPSSGANPWQHHHYISPSSAASFPQSQDRYICPTCNKAFSRPSSLRIHSHSHTGEKPFKCPHQGCGKAFSVRSNMKRHERGCHTFES